MYSRVSSIVFIYLCLLYLFFYFFFYFSLQTIVPRSSSFYVPFILFLLKSRTTIRFVFSCFFNRCFIFALCSLLVVLLYSLPSFTLVALFCSLSLSLSLSHSLTLSFSLFFFYIGNTLRLKYITDVNEKNVLEREKETKRRKRREYSTHRQSPQDLFGSTRQLVSS